MAIALKNFSKKKFLFSALIIILLIVVANQTKKEVGYISPSSAEEVLENQVLTYFYYWYDLPGGTHSTALTDNPSDQSTSYKNISWFENQLIDMHQAAIDTALVVYWADKEPSAHPGLLNLVSARKNLIARGLNVPKIALFLDTGIFGQMRPSARNLRSNKGKEKFYSYIKEFYQKIPQEDWGLINHKPIIWLYGNYFQIEFNQETFDFVYQSFHRDFGIKPYIVREASWNYPQKRGWFSTKIDTTKPIKTDNFYEWGGALHGYKDVGGVASVGPGYDERELQSPDRKGRFRSRENGMWFRDNLVKAVASGKKLVVIETWNEFHEATEIAPTREYGRQFIEIAASFLTNF